MVGKNDPVSGQAIFAFVTTKARHRHQRPTLARELREHVAKVIGPIARPKYLLFTPDLPKTRSGKIMRRLLRDVAEGRPWATRPRSPTRASSTASAPVRARPRRTRLRP